MIKISNKKITYDKWGRMNYNPKIHFKQSTKWEEEDLNYLINWYDKIGREEMSFALGRTEKTISQKVSQLRKEGKMKVSEKILKFRKEIKREIS